jgi:hypothetical protein
MSNSQNFFIVSLVAVALTGSSVVFHGGEAPSMAAFGVRCGLFGVALFALLLSLVQAYKTRAR